MGMEAGVMVSIPSGVVETTEASGKSGVVQTLGITNTRHSKKLWMLVSEYI